MEILVWMAMLSLSLVFAGGMLFYSSLSQEQVKETQDYVTAQNESDAYATKYASLSSFDVNTVGYVDVQDVINLIFNNISNGTTVLVKGPDGVLRAFVSGSDGWTYSSNGKPLGRKINAEGAYYDDPVYNTNVGVVNIVTQEIPDYDVLYNYLANYHVSPVKYMVNINPDNEGTLDAILIVAVN